MQEDKMVTRRIDQMLLLLGRRPKLPLSSANVFLVSCAQPRQVMTVTMTALLLDHSAANSYKLCPYYKIKPHVGPANSAVN